MKNIFFTLFIFAFAIGTSQGQSFRLDEAVAYGLQHSNNIKMKQIDIATANQDIKDFRAIGIPQVNGGIDYQHYFRVPVQPVNDFISPAVYGVLFQENILEQRDLGTPDVFELGFIQPNVLTAKIEANALLFDGTYIYGLKAAKLYKELVNRQLELTEQEIKANVTKAYMAVLIAQRNQEILKKNIMVLEQSVLETQAVYDNGFAESLDVERLQLSLDDITTQSKNLDQLIRISKNVLKFQMGYPAEEEILLSDDIESLQVAFAKDEYAMSDQIDYSNRAEYRILETNAELNELDLKRYKSGYLPSARAFASLQESLQRTNLFDSSEAGWLPTVVAGLSVNIPIYDGGQKSAKIQKSKLKIESIGLQQDEFKRGVSLAVNNSYLAYQNAKETLENRKKSLALSEKIYNKTQIKFKEGVGSSVELKQAESSLYQSQGSYINALYDLLSTKVDLDIALGKL